MRQDKEVTVKLSGGIVETDEGFSVVGFVEGEDGGLKDVFATEPEWPEDEEDV